MTDKRTKSGAFILIVEDDRGTSELEAQRLEPLGFEIRRAADADETIAILTTASPELMLLDYSLPGGNAMELVKRLRETGIPLPPFLIVTGRGDEAVAVETMKAGASDYIVKNSDFLENLAPAARKALEKAALLAKLDASQKNTAKNLRLYNFLAQINQAAAREKDRKVLLQEICRIAVRTGGLKMAWVGTPDRDTGRINQLCSAGEAAGYLEGLHIDYTGGRYSTSPMAACVAARRITASFDIATDPNFVPWREKALGAGFMSSAAIPLTDGDNLMAALGLYSAEPGFFSQDEIKLLEEIQGDVSLALTAISAEEKRAAAQAALTRTADQLAHVLSANPVMLFTLRHKNGRFIPEWVSGNAQTLTGYDPAEILAPGWWSENLHPADKAAGAPDMGQLLRKGALTQDFRFRKKNGKYFWAHAQLKVSAPETGEITGSWTDITLIKESEARFEELFEKAPIGYQSLDADGNLLAVNETWTAVFGYSKKEALGRNFVEFLTPEYKKTFMENFPRFKANGEIREVEFEIKRKDGASRHITFNGKAANNYDGTFRQSHCVFTDTTDTWKSRRQMDLLSQAIKASSSEIYLFDAASFRFIFVNRGAAKNLGYSAGELESLAPWDLEKEFTEASFRSKLAPLLRGELETLSFETSHTRKDGTSYPVEVNLQHIKSSSNPVLLAVANDITVRRRADRMMRELAGMQRVEALGALAGGIAHDFNNMLTGIMGNLSLLNARSRDAESAGIINETLAAARSAQSLTTQLLAFAKGGIPVKKEFRLGAALKEIFSLSTSGTKAACRISIPNDLWSVEGDENQVKQAVNNMLLNASQAMPDGGTLSLTAENLRLGGTGMNLLPPGPYVRIRISDTGIGIAPQTLDRIFEPYFTTKEQGHGLGLCTAWSIVKNHGGHIGARSEPGKGTTFEVCLPATGRRPAEAGGSPCEIQKGSGRVLVLEDEEVVSRAVKRMLEQLGYTCEITLDGGETVRRYQECRNAGAPFDIVIMDLTIPGGLGGKEAVKALRAVAPEAPVIVSSGYSDEAVMADYKAYGFDAVLPKPYKYEDLAETLARLLRK